MRCRECGQENPEQNRFCGMCGERLERLAPPQESRPAEPREEAPREQPRAMPQERHEPGLGGMSFLGLSDEYREEPRDQQPFLGVGRADEYDEEEGQPRRGWRIVLALLFVGIVGALLWVQMRRSGADLGQLWAEARSALSAQLAGRSENAAPVEPTQSQQEPAETVAAGEEAAESAAVESDAAATETEATAPAEPDKSAEMPQEQPETAAAEPGGVAAEQPATPESDHEAQAEEPKAAGEPEQPEPQEEEAVSAPAAGRQELETARRYLNSDPSEAARWLWKATGLGNAEAPVLLSNLYLRGEGVPRSCEQAVVLLNSASRRPNARSRAQLARLYASGQCVDRDALAAYHWYTLALAADPGNDFIRRERQALWNRMSEMERQEAQAMEKSTVSERRP